MKYVGLMAVAGLLIAGSAMAQQVYRWVDEDGVVHFSQQPPPDRQQVEQHVLDRTPLTAPPASAAPGAPSADQTQSESGQQAADNAAAGRDADMCSQVRQSLATMRESEVINMTMPDGSIQQIHGDSRQAEINRLLAMQDYYC